MFPLGKDARFLICSKNCDLKDGRCEKRWFLEVRLSLRQSGPDIRCGPFLSFASAEIYAQKMKILRSDK